MEQASSAVWDAELLLFQYMDAKLVAMQRILEETGCAGVGPLGLPLASGDEGSERCALHCRSACGQPALSRRSCHQQ